MDAAEKLLLTFFILSAVVAKVLDLSFLVPIAAVFAFAAAGARAIAFFGIIRSLARQPQRTMA